MKSDDDIKREQLVDFLKEHGWDDQKANELLNDKVGLVTIDIPGRVLLDVLTEVCKEGIPLGNFTIPFMVPQSNWDSFKELAAKAIAKHGGFVFTPEEKAMTVKGNETEH